MTTLLGQSSADQYAAFRQSLYEEFQKGNMVLDSLIVLGGILVIVLIAYWLSLRQRRLIEQPHVNDPARLFRSVLDRLALRPEQRRLIEAVAAAGGGEHPTALLLSPVLFHEGCNRWIRGHGELPDLSPQRLEPLLEETKLVLFRTS